MTVSPDTLIHRIRQTQLPPPPAPKVIGVDDWAKHKGQNYGTILVDRITAVARRDKVNPL
jgi:hypothetical protein